MNKLQLLVVEDDAPVRNLITTTLKAHEYKHIVAATGDEAIRQSSTCNPDIVLLDLGLPDMDGVEVIRRIRTWSNMPIIVISARSEDSDKIEALDNGADDYLTKSSVADCCTKASIFVGEKENGAMKESARSIQRALPGSNIN